jgi:phosphatidylserine/phosphatidylglycerophosphate/cardiolipin synthase-like enzyme
MIETIRSAQHYVYIENQFFISLVQTLGKISRRDTIFFLQQNKTQYKNF